MLNNLSAVHIPVVKTGKMRNFAKPETEVDSHSKQFNADYSFSNVQRKRNNHRARLHKSISNYLDAEASEKTLKEETN